MRWFWQKEPKQEVRRTVAPIFLTNTLSCKKERFIPPEHRPVRIYNCGPTVYDVPQIGNYRSYVFADTLRRTLVFNGIEVKQVINITDVGHLTSDADEGEDKMKKALKRESKQLTLENMKELGERYAAIFLDDLKKLNIDTARVEFPRASDYIETQIALIQTLEEKGYVYALEDGLYFNTALFPEYGKLGNINIEQLKEGARVAIHAGKQNATDFALWKFNRKVGWNSPWGKGFPGWHIECSAMARSTLGEQIDIHTGGIDHIPVHHNNEIAQSEAATGKKPFAQFWLHNAFITINDKRIGKSEDNAIHLRDVEERKIMPLAYRYWLLGGHYRTPMNFSWEALEGAQNALRRLYGIAASVSEQPTMPDEHWSSKFHERINDDLDTPGALAVMWDMARDKTLPPAVLIATLVNFERALGIGLSTSLLHNKKKRVIAMEDVPQDIQVYIEKREEARRKESWEKADELREKIQKAGFNIEDTAKGARVTKR